MEVIYVISLPDGRLLRSLVLKSSAFGPHRGMALEFSRDGNRLAATVARLEANGVGLLRIPENYYDDLEAKTDLPPRRLDDLRAHNILYDRDGGAEYLQVYTQTFEERFFFEIVERRGYAGFGAANAPIRLAAQTRLARRRTAPASAEE